MKRIIALLLSLTLLGSLSGCAMLENWNTEEPYTDPEDELIEETYAALFAALDQRDREAVLVLFAENSRKQDKDIETEVLKMLERWPGDTQRWYYDGISGGAYSTDYGMKTASVTAMIPVFAGEETFWVLLEICYRDDADERNEGITRMLFYTAEDYCRLRENRDYKHPDSDGLHVFAEEAHDPHVVCIDQFPIRMRDAEPLDLLAAADFLKTNRSWEAFTQRFGQPHGTSGSGVMSAYYWLEPENGALRVLDLGVADFEDEIWGVYVDDSLEQHGLWGYLGIDPPDEPADSTE